MAIKTTDEGLDESLDKSANKNRALHLLRFLERHTDEEHPAATTDIIAYLEAEGVPASRKTVARDVEQLIAFGVDVICGRGRQNSYFIGARHFETPELKLLIDAAQASKFLTAKRSKALIDKLAAQTSDYQAADLRAGLYVDKLVKPKNETAYLTVDALFAAIAAKMRVRFMYWDYLSDKRKVYKHNRRVYEFSPYALIWNNDSYYAVGHSESHGAVATFRIDRMAALKMTDAPAVPSTEGFDAAAYANSVFQMYDGATLDVTLKCENDFMKVIVDRFGEDVKTSVADEGHFYATASVAASRTFYGWVFSLGGATVITAPPGRKRIPRHA